MCSFDNGLDCNRLQPRYNVNIMLADIDVMDVSLSGARRVALVGIGSGRNARRRTGILEYPSGENI